MPNENNNNDGILNFIKGPIINIINAKNRLNTKGIMMIAKGINTLKLSSKVNELVIHEIPAR